MNNQSNNSNQWQNQTAIHRFQIISALLDENLDTAKRSQLRRQLADQHGISVRSLFRYEKAYRLNAFEGLKPESREQKPSDKLPDNFGELIQEAIQLKREVPSRSVNQIILILEMEDQIAPGMLKRSTVQRYLYQAGFGKKQMKKYTEAQKSSTKRFCKPHRMMLAQADIKYVMKLPIGPGGKSIQCYICSIIDDHSKLILASDVFDRQDASVVEEVYRKAILSFGAFDATYVDNGKPFVSRELISALSQLGIRHMRAKPYSGQSKGKIEVYNRLINSYIAECQAQKVRTLEDARKYWKLFVEEYYHSKAHDGIREYYESHGVAVPAEGITPRMEFNRDSRPLKFIDAAVIGRAFRHHGTREVDKGACISFNGRKYEVSASLIGATVTIEWDPADDTVLTVSYTGIEPVEVKPMVIGEFCDKTPEVPQCMLPVQPENSRFLEGLARRKEERLSHFADAISFNGYREGGED